MVQISAIQYIIIYAYWFMHKHMLADALYFICYLLLP